MAFQLDRKTAIAIPVALAVGGVGTGLSNTSESHDQLHKAENGVKQQILDGTKSSILEDGQASIELKDGSQVNIKNPILVKAATEHITDSLVVLGQNPDHKDMQPVKGFYKGSGNIHDNLSVNGISYSQNGVKISAEQALSRSTEEAIAFDDNGGMIVAQGQKHAGEPVAQGIPAPKPAQ